MQSLFQNQNMRKILAIICTIITLGALKETIRIFTSTGQDIVGQRPILIVIALSITIPLLILTLWLWSPGRKKSGQQN